MEGYTVISMLKYIYHIMKIGNLFSKLVYIYNRLRPSIKIGVYGDSGTGKSQFLSTITGNGIYKNGSTMNLKRYKLVLESGRAIEFIDTPGHHSLSINRERLKIKIQNNKITGIINIVSYGYQDNPDIDLDEAFDVDKKEVKESYLEDNRKREIERTEEIIKAIVPEVKLKWIITLVNKADIWYKDKNEVLKYYKEGNYHTKISELQCTTNLFVYPFCSIITPFANRPMLLIYGEKDKYQMYDDFFEGLQELVSD